MFLSTNFDFPVILDGQFSSLIIIYEMQWIPTHLLSVSVRPLTERTVMIIHVEGLETPLNWGD